MISVPSRRPRLSGNSPFIILSALLLISCDAFKVISSPAKGGGTDEIVEDTAKQDPIIVVDNKTSEPKEIDFFGNQVTVAPHKLNFKVALLMPFNTHDQTGRNKRTSDVMLEYYQGVKLALQELEEQGLKAELFVYDTKDDLSTLNSLLGKSSMKEMDLIVGPVHKAQVLTVARFGKENGIPVVSPLTSISGNGEDLGYFYCTTPSPEMKAQGLGNYLKKYKGYKFIFVSDTGWTNRKIRRSMEDELKQKVHHYDFGVKDWSPVIDEDEKAVVYIYSNDPNKVSSTLSKLYQTKGDVTVIGDYTWTNFADNDYQFWDKLHVHLLASDYVNDTLNRVKTFRLNFRDTNNDDPSIYGYLGYDQFKFFGNMLLTFGEHFPSYVLGHEFRYLASRYNMRKSEGLIENHNVFILEFKDFSLQEIR